MVGAPSAPTYIGNDERGIGQMNKNNQSSMINSQAVNKQLLQFEEQSGQNEKDKAGSTNEIQPMVKEDGLSQ